MGIQVTIPTYKIKYTKQQLEDWKADIRDDCPEGYCKGLPGSCGFGEYLVGQYFASQGYFWIHHDFNVFGGNKLGKYPKAEEVLCGYLGRERYERGRSFAINFAPYTKVEDLIY